MMLVRDDFGRMWQGATTSQCLSGNIIPVGTEYLLLEIQTGCIQNRKQDYYQLHCEAR